MKFSKDEQETTINFDAVSGMWVLYTCVPLHINSFMKSTAINQAEIEVLTSWEGKPTSIRFKAENTAISLASLLKKKRIKREPSEAQIKARQKFAEMAKARSRDSQGCV